MSANGRTRSTSGQEALGELPQLRIATWGVEQDPLSGCTFEDPATARSQAGDAEGVGGHNLRPRSARLLPDSLLGDEEAEVYNEDDDYEGQGSSGEERDVRKKVGRPIEYKGDPNAPGLTEAESRRIKRRIANRESARRVRTKRQEFLEDLQLKITSMQKQNRELTACCAEIERHKATLMHQMYLLRDRWTEASQENVHLRNEVAALRQTLEADLNLGAKRGLKSGRSMAISSLPTVSSAFELPNLSQLQPRDPATSAVATVPEPQAPTATATTATSRLLEISPLTGLSSLRPVPSKTLPQRQPVEPAGSQAEAEQALIDTGQLLSAGRLFGSLACVASGALGVLSRAPDKSSSS